MNKKQKQHQTTVAGNPLAVNVIGSQREDLGFALKSWKRKVKNAGILERVKDRKEFEKPSVTKRKQLQAAQFMQRIKDLNSF
jgi:small subunit ribosomal protein S21